MSHPDCLTDFGVEGVISSQLPNSWHCPKCMKYNPPPEDQLDEPPSKLIKTEGGDAAVLPGQQQQQFVVRGTSDQSKQSLRSQLAEQILSASQKQVKQPMYVVRPPPLNSKVQDIYDRRSKAPQLDLRLERQLLLPILRFLPTLDLASCGLVCRTWHTATLDPSLHHTVNLTGRKISTHLLSITVQKQPAKLVLDWTNLVKPQLSWLLPRLPQTKSLSLVGLEYNLTVSAMTTCNCPVLHELDLSYVANLSDASLHKLLTTPQDSRPGLLDKKSRLKNLHKLCVNNTEVGDISLRYLTQYLPQLTYLGVAGCWKLTNAGLAMLGQVEDSRLATLDMTNCRGLTDLGLEQLAGLAGQPLARVETEGSGVTSVGLDKFVSKAKGKLKVFGHVIDKKPPPPAKKENKRRHK